MATPRDRLSNAESNRIYEQEIKPLHLGGIDRSSAPTVVFVGGSPGSGKTVLVPHVAARLASTSGAAVVLSVDELREHHPAWPTEARRDAQAAERFNPDASLWVNKLYRDAIAERKNVVFETGFKRPELLAETVRHFREAGYRIEAVILAVDADQTKRAVMGRFLDAQEKDQVPRLVTAARYEEGYAGLRRTLDEAEKKHLVDDIRLVKRDGYELYRNTVVDGKWQREPAAIAALDKERDRPQTAADLANNAIAWHQITARAQLNPKTPRNAIEQAVTWRKDATAQALADPKGAKQYQWKLAGEALRKMPREDFLREFPTYAGAVELLDRAKARATTEYAHPQDRAGFVAEVRERVATQIEDGRQFGRVKVAEARQPTKARDDDLTR